MKAKITIVILMTLLIISFNFNRSLIADEKELKRYSSDFSIFVMYQIRNHINSDDPSFPTASIITLNTINYELAKSIIHKNEKVEEEIRKAKIIDSHLQDILKTTERDLKAKKINNLYEYIKDELTSYEAARENP